MGIAVNIRAPPPGRSTQNFWEHLKESRERTGDMGLWVWEAGRGEFHRHTGKNA